MNQMPKRRSFFSVKWFFLHNLNSPFKNMTQNPGDAIARLKCDGTDRNLKWKGSYANGRGSDASYPIKPSQLDFFLPLEALGFKTR